jgi:endonuclease-8
MLYLRGIDPWRSVGEVEHLDALVELGQRLLDANKTRLDQVTTGDTRLGRQSWVHRRAGQPCRRCGTTIRRGKQGPIGE